MDQASLSSEVSQRQRSQGSAGRRGLVSPSSAACHRQGSSWAREAQDDSVDAAAEVEVTRRTLAEAQATTLRDMERLQDIQRDIAEAA